MPLKRFLLALGSLVIIAAFIFGGAAVYVYMRYTAPSKLEAARDIVIPEGTGVRGIAVIFKNYHIIEQPFIYLIGLRVSGLDRALRAGEYHFPAHVSPKQANEILAKGETVKRFVTLPEGLRSSEIVERLGKTEGLTGEIEVIPADGSLLPETYQFSFGDSRQSILNRMHAAQEKLLGDLWPDRASDLPFDTEQEALTLASIIERETGIPAERARIAGVFVNRLTKGMRLQSDPTVAYAVSPDHRLDRPLSRGDLKVDNPYNTYVYAGLPPAPIANPGRDAIYAALHPAKTDEIYFVADGSGGHAFARTLKEHNRNVQHWRKLEKAQQ